MMSEIDLWVLDDMITENFVVWAMCCPDPRLLRVLLTLLTINLSTFIFVVYISMNVASTDKEIDIEFDSDADSDDEESDSDDEESDADNEENLNCDEISDTPGVSDNLNTFDVDHNSFDTLDENH